MKMILRYLEIEKFKGGAETKIRDQDTLKRSAEAITQKARLLFNFGKQ